MKKWYCSLNVYYKTALWSFLGILVAFLSTIWCYFSNLNEIPFGILLGGLIGILSYILIGVSEKLDLAKKTLVFSVIVTVIKFVIIAATLVLVSVFYYKLDLKVFNVFAVGGGYFVSFIVFLILTLIERGKEKKNA